MDYQQLLVQLKKDLPNPGHGLFPTELMGWLIFGIITFVVIVSIIWGLCALGKVYGVWAAHKSGMADLARAQNEQMIQVSQAQGRLKAAQLNMDAEIIDASAVAKSVEIIGRALHDNAGYLQWQWIHMMKSNPGSTIYVPTEANLPILEAGKRPSRVVKDDDDLQLSPSEKERRHATHTLGG